jgi:hypothetical protein
MPALALRHTHPHGRHRAVRYYASFQSAYRFHPLPGISVIQLYQLFFSFWQLFHMFCAATQLFDMFCAASMSNF